MTTAMVKQELAVASFSTVYDLEQVETALNDLNDGASDALRATYEKMLRAGNLRFCVKPTRMPSFDVLSDALPNFAEPLADVRKQVALCLNTEDRLELMPILLIGPPGIGKTHFAKALAQMLGTSYHYVPMSSLTAGWILSGASSQWRNAKPGRVFDALVNGRYANPVITVDELDKAGCDTQYDPLGALYALLEHDTARTFVDEFAEVPIDAGNVIWIATANVAHAIPDPILNRMNVYEIAPPDAAGARRIAQAIYDEIRNAHAWGRCFPDTLGDDALAVLAATPPRTMRRALLHAFGAARLDGRDAVAPRDIRADDGTGKRRPIGF